MKRTAELKVIQLASVEKKEYRSMLREADKDLVHVVDHGIEPCTGILHPLHWIRAVSPPFPVRFFKDELTVLVLCFLRYHAGNRLCPYPLFVLMQ